MGTLPKPGRSNVFNSNRKVGLETWQRSQADELAKCLPPVPKVSDLTAKGCKCGNCTHFKPEEKYCEHKKKDVKQYNICEHWTALTFP
jgi:hypothetical protein